MPVGEPGQSSSLLLARRMLWNRDVGQPPRPLPIIILLGPAGSGKTNALNAISRDFDWGVVHARFNFDRDEPVTTVEVLTRLVYDLSRDWRHRAKPHFTRFTIALIAIQATLDGVNLERDKDKLRDLLNELRRNLHPQNLEAAVNVLVDAAGALNLLQPPYVDLLRQMLPRVIRSVGRRRLGKAMRSLADFPQAEGASPLDALVALNQLAHQQPPDLRAVTAWLTEAFLADVRDNHRRMSAPDARSPCVCSNPTGVRHLHNWVLLLDNVDHPGGTDFLADLTTAREDYRRQHPDDRSAPDALLVMATSGRWHAAWQSAWRPTWKPDPGAPDRSRAVPPCHAATYDHWADPSGAVRQSPYYPVMLDALRIGDIAQILGTTTTDPKAILTHRATGGLPAAVVNLAAPLKERTGQPGARDGLEGPSDGPWYARLTELGLADRLLDVRIEDFVTAAPFATAPWLIPTSATSRISQPHVARILTELRTALWVTAPADGGVTTDHVTLHPWIAANLTSALARRPNESGPSYAQQFAALRDDPDTATDPVRTAYCQLALGQIGAVVTQFETDFDRVPHQDWLDRVKLVAHAPNAQPLERNYRQLYEELVNLDIAGKSRGRTEIRNNVTRLIAAGWLAANPFAVRGQEQNNEIANALAALARASQRPDVSALYEAAELAKRGLLP